MIADRIAATGAETVDLTTRVAIHTYLKQVHPELSRRDRARCFDVLLDTSVQYHVTDHYTLSALEQAVESALVRFRQMSTTKNARRYLKLLAPLVQATAASDGRALPARPRPAVTLPLRVGSYIAETFLGQGGEGVALAGRHVETGIPVTIKLRPRGEQNIFQYLHDDWHPGLVRILGDSWPNGTDLSLPWIAREYADATLDDVLTERRGEPLPLSDALGIFATCCDVIAWLHERHIYRWSAHRKNVFRVGGTWKAGDLGRCLVYLPPDHPWIDSQRRPILERLGSSDPSTMAMADWILNFIVWGHPTSIGTVPYHIDHEWRLRVDDCSVLAGLLVDLLTGRHLYWFYRALVQLPFCSAHYSITEDRSIDEALSVVLNQAWRGDGGCAPLLANAGRGDQSVYLDPRELLADVQSALGSIARTPERPKEPLTSTGGRTRSRGTSDLRRRWERASAESSRSTRDASRENQMAARLTPSIIHSLPPLFLNLG